jgi:hypothetical protein
MFWVIQATIVSFVIIFVMHNLYVFFKETLTVPKMKDLVRRPQQKYDALFRELQTQPTDTKSDNATISNEPANDAMKNELKRYLMELNAPASEPVPQQQSSMTSSSFIELGSAYQ